MLLKLLDRSDIIRYGKTIMEIPDRIAFNLIKAKRAIEFIGKPKDDIKTVPTPPENKMVWVPPEEKFLEHTIIDDDKPYPGVNDYLFPVHIISK